MYNTIIIFYHKLVFGLFPLQRSTCTFASKCYGISVYTLDMYIYIYYKYMGGGCVKDKAFHECVGIKIYSGLKSPPSLPLISTLIMVLRWLLLYSDSLIFALVFYEQFITSTIKTV